MNHIGLEKPNIYQEIKKVQEMIRDELNANNSLTTGHKL
jgi:hypothetical protein